MLSKIVSIVGFSLAGTMLASFGLIMLNPPRGVRNVKPVPAFTKPEDRLEAAIKRAERAAEQAEAAQLRVAESKVIPALPLPPQQQERLPDPDENRPIRNRYGAPLYTDDKESLRDYIFRTQGMEIK